MVITIIGTGNMARAIAMRALAGGHTVDIHSRDAKKGAQLAAELGEQASAQAIGGSVGDITVLAVPYTEIANLITSYDGFAGKTLVDITNPIDFSTFQPILASDTSGAEEIAKLAPEAKVVKAFNTTFSGPLMSGEIKGTPLDVFIVGNDAAAKTAVAELVTSSGMRAIDFGDLTGARHLEGFQYLHMAHQDSLGTGWMSGIAIVG